MKYLIPLLLSLFVFTASPLRAEDDSSKEIENTTVLEAGTYKVTTHRVDEEEKEIYVKTDKDETVELYFKDDTKLTQDDKTVPFSTLKKGQKLEITVEKDGKHNKPVAVKILE